MTNRNLSLSSRAENTRFPQVSKYIKFDLEKTKEYFEEDLNSIISMSDLILDTHENSKCQLVYQSQIILLESAFDYYLHNMTKYGVNRIYERNWDSTQKYNNITMDLKTVEAILNNECDEDWFYAYISEYYSKTTMVSFDSFKGQMNLIGLDIQEVANTAFYQQGSKENVNEQLKNKINALYNCRNAIAHQFARSHTDALRKDIYPDDVKKHIDNIKKIVNAIHIVAMNKG